MTRFEQSMNDGFAKKIPVDIIKAKSLLKSAQQAFYSAKKLPLEEGTLKSVFRELYEGLRQYCEALGYIQGYKFASHEVITFFLEDILNERKIAGSFDRYRKIRNGINYYGDDVPLQLIQEVLKEIPLFIAILRKHSTITE